MIASSLCSAKNLTNGDFLEYYGSYFSSPLHLSYEDAQFYKNDFSKSRKMETGLATLSATFFVCRILVDCGLKLNYYYVVIIFLISLFIDLFGFFGGITTLFYYSKAFVYNNKDFGTDLNIINIIAYSQGADELQFIFRWKLLYIVLLFIDTIFTITFLVMGCKQLKYDAENSEQNSFGLIIPIS